MWNIGELLCVYIDEHDIAPHALYRKIYGKSEGVENKVQKSYITREFLGRCYRVRNIFTDKSSIRESVPNLKKVRLFIESMPFIDNKKYRLEGKERENLFKLLNSDDEYQKIISEIRKLQKEKIDIKNPRTQKLHQMQSEADVFINFYNYLYELIELKDYQKVNESIGDISTKFLKILGQNTSALAADNLKYTPFEISDDIPADWREFADVIKRLNEQNTPKSSRRFRRLVPPERIVQLADMIYALSSEKSYREYTSGVN